MHQVKPKTQARQLAVALILSSLFSIALFAARALAGDSNRYWFLNWNLALAWLPLLLAWTLKKRLRNHPWLNWRSLVLTAMWLAFLPNSFYLVSDFVHLHDSREVSLLYDVVLFASFAFNGLTLGFISVYLVHKELLAKIRARDAHLVIAAVLLLSGFAIYVGRNLRWNTWDVLFNPAGLLFAISDRFINSGSHPQMFTITLIFFALLASLYAFIWRLINIFVPTAKP